MYAISVPVYEQKWYDCYYKDKPRQKIFKKLIIERKQFALDYPHQMYYPVYTSYTRIDNDMELFMHHSAQHVYNRVKDMDLDELKLECISYPECSLQEYVVFAVSVKNVKTGKEIMRVTLFDTSFFP